MKKPPLGILISGHGSNLQAIIDAIETGFLSAKIACVVSNKKEAYGLKRAEKHRIPTHVIRHQDYPSREAFEKALIQIFDPYKIELVILAGFMRVLTPQFIRHYPHRIMNIHPALLPSFPGVEAIQQAYDYGVKVTGVTVHLIDEGTDTGPIILQTTVPLKPDDTLESLTERVHAVEHKLYPQAIQLFAEERLEIQGRKVLIKDS